MTLRIFTLISLLLLANNLKAQLFQQKSFYPNTSTITRKSFNGSGGQGFWALEHLDSLGRTIAKDYYRNKKLLQQDLYTYNEKNDLVKTVVAFDINNPKRRDTTTYEYVYTNGLISTQKQISSHKHLTIIKLEENIGDSILKYSSIAYTYVPDKKITITTEKQYIATMEKNRLVKLWSKGVNNELGEVTIRYEYDGAGKLQRRWTNGNTPAMIMLGSPGGNPIDEYTYRYDRHGRPTKFYSKVNGENILLASYNYK